MWRTNASHPAGSYRPDYLEGGKQRLKEQAGEALSKVKGMAIQGQDAVSAKTADLTGAARDTVQRWAADIREAAEDVGTSLTNNAPSIAPSAGDIGHFTRRRQIWQVRRSTVALPQPRATLRDPESRDKVLLGVAGLAVAAALGIACQKRLSEGGSPGKQQL